MFSVVKATNRITMTAGDTVAIKFTPKFNGVPYVFTGLDMAVMTVKRKLTDEAPLIEKYSGDGNIELLPADTKDLPPGEYIYDVELRKDATGDVYTYITGVNGKPAILEIMGQVTQ